MASSSLVVSYNLTLAPLESPVPGGAFLCRPTACAAPTAGRLRLRGGLTALLPHWIVIAEPVAATEIAVDDRGVRSPPKTNVDLRPVVNL